MSKPTSPDTNVVLTLGPDIASFGLGGLDISKNADTGKPNDHDGLVIKPREKIVHVTEYWDQDKMQWKQTRVGKPLKNTKKQKARKYIFKCARREDRNGGLAKSFVHVYGEHIRGVFKEITREDRGPSFHENEVLDFTTMKLLWHRKGDLEARLRRETEVAFPNHTLIFELEASIDLVDEVFADVHTELDSLDEGEITFDLLWTCFPPLSLVTGVDSLGQQRLYRVRETRYGTYGNGERFFLLVTDHISSNGKQTGFVSDEKFQIDEFRSAKLVLGLPHHPFSVRPNHKQEREALIERGDKWLQLRGRHIQEYQGHAVNGEDHGYGKFNSHGRVVLDPATFDQVRPNNRLVPRIITSLSDFTDEHKLLVDPVLYGFSLGDKIWGGFAVSSLTDVLWDNDIIDNLVIPEDQKDFVRTLVESHLNSGFDDIVRDKGKGLVGLLSGSPGVGKTLTAEAVAEIARRPLYMVSSGELGDSPTSVQKALDDIMELAEAWHAVVLLDEADVFLIKRDDTNLTRNALTSIFLRQLEYYQGIILLTTNRRDSFDPAFKSRIHFSIDYPDLDLDARRTIWGMFLRRTSDSGDVVVEITESELIDLARLQLNGRQIKNAVKISHTTALQKSVPITLAYIQRTLKFSNI